MYFIALINGLDPLFQDRYKASLEVIRQKVREKLSPLGGLWDVSTGDYPCAQVFYEELVQRAQGKDVLILNAHAGALCTQELSLFLDYQKKHNYEVLMAENLPEGLLPSLISGKFLSDFVSFLPRDKALSASFKDIINWEYQGIDVGIWLSPSRIVLKRAAFLPEDRGSVAFLQHCAAQNDLSLSVLEDLIPEEPRFPRYVALEISRNGVLMDYSLFEKLLLQLDALAPEAVVSLGIHGEPFSHPQLDKFLSAFSPQRKILVESPSEILDFSRVQQALARPLTEVIFSDSPLLKEFLKKFPDQKHLWARLNRDKKSEARIRPFLNEFSFLGNRALIAKSDSFGDPSQQSVDLSPLTRHACYSLGREMLFNPLGGLMVCRQAPEISQGSLADASLEQLWEKRRCAYRRQLAQPAAEACPLCPSCDDWWIFNF